MTANEENISPDDQEWTFNLIVLHPVLSHEFLAIAGGCQSLGNWQHAYAVVMDRQEGSENWTAIVKIPRDKKVSYRYFICVVEPKTKGIIVRRWETHPEPRVIDVCDDRQVQIQDVFGSVNGVERIQRGWLTTESILQLKFFDDPFVLQKGQKNCVVWIKVTPKRIQFHQGRPIMTCIDSIYAFAEVVRYVYGMSTIQPQEEEFGVPYAEGDIVIFHITVDNFKHVAYLMEFFCWESGQNDPPTCIGTNYILPTDLMGSTGQFDLPIVDVNNKYPSGIVQIQYLVVTPMASSIKQNLKYSFSRQWCSSWRGLDIGHRGSGASNSSSDVEIPENTIGSIRNAGDNGADMVEFDVHLTKDLVPIVYHDFHVNISLGGLAPVDESDLIEVPVKDLTWEQLKCSDIYRVTGEGIVRYIQPPSCTGGRTSCCTADDFTLFPSLEKFFDIIDPRLAFDVELKWPQELVNNGMEGRQTIDKNLFVDRVLEVLLRKGHGRYVVVSSFDVDICTMLRFKQNIYPVMLLTLGPTKRYPHYRDPRCNSIVKAVCNAQAMELLGVVLHSEDLLKDISAACIAKRMSLVVFCWGNDTREVEKLATLKKSTGLDGIIYDKCDILSGKFVKQNDFRTEVKRCLDKLLQT